MQKYFEFSRKESRGITVLLLFIVLVWITPIFYGYVFVADDINYSDMVKPLISSQQMDQFEKPQDEEVSGNVAHLFHFNPNQLPVTEWEKLGLSEQQINNIKNYESKGGTFRTKEDFKKLYTITETDYENLEKYIALPSRSDMKKPVTRNNENVLNEKKEKKVRYNAHPTAYVKTIELNAADSTDLLQLRGIGKVFASRIIKYRALLGGYSHPDQLLEVYGMDSLRYKEIKQYLWVDKAKIRSININEAEYETLIKHPYIKPKDANVIVQYRRQHGTFNALEELLSIDLFNDEYLLKIAPYLTLMND
ncbi:helix-hairpin-helix domain-containing protein [Olivibacter sp. SDN3]|uniref:helix-hairpin-helix domain-containing protein n=1 Tax=Olivibacter sp. SDN3 TaxID=2764720 RepID=UPI001650E156|nr:helix-hairpin-helix domain-containing protein [Olivibacter sp. SDN3]QNL52155.1 helix-hairpin-helix domain-containing protein [Olivibacter sp. SDN3]